LCRIVLAKVVHRGAEANSNGAHKHMGFSKLQLRMNYVIQFSAPVIRSPPATSSVASERRLICALQALPV
jgi:hypothetical protein